MLSIGSAVGVGQINHPADVCIIQKLLNSLTHAGNSPANLKIDGIVGSRTLAQIKQFQTSWVKLRNADGIISPTGITLRHLIQHNSLGTPNAGPASLLPSDVPADHHYRCAAHIIGCDSAAVKAVVVTELAGCKPFDHLGRPTILFERHYFHRLTQGRFGIHSDISHPQRGAYGKFSEQYIKLEKAILLHRQAALKSASWGAFQIMGDNYVRAGFVDIELFTQAMNRLEGQFSAFISFIMSSQTLRRALTGHQWEAFAKEYNGSQYKENKYDIKMLENYRKFNMLS